MNSTPSSWPFISDPVWPFSLPWAGWVLFVVVAVLLTGLTIGSYSLLPGVRRSRVLTILALRLIALALLFFFVAGVSYVSVENQNAPSTVVVLLDRSQSMTVNDEANQETRWSRLQRELRDAQPVIDNLQRDHNISVLFYTFGDSVAEYDPANPGEPNGQRTDTAQALQVILDRYRGDRFFRGVYVLSDGADNGAGEPTPGRLAADFRSLRMPISTFRYGKPTTNDEKADIAVTSFRAPDAVPLKGKLKVNATIDALRMTNPKVRLRLYLDGKPVEQDVVIKLNDEDVTGKDQFLTKTHDNRVEIECLAPATPGDVKVTLKVLDPVHDRGLNGELTDLNNEKSSYVTVTSEGISVLIVDREGHFPEPQMIIDALNEDSRIRVTTLWLRGNNLSPAQKNLFDFGRQKYDVIIIGDAKAEQFRQADPTSLDTISRMVAEQNVGLLMMGGRYSFGNGDWQDTPIAKVMPNEFNQAGQAPGDVKLLPTPTGVKHFILRLVDGNDDTVKEWWNKRPALNGYTVLGKLRGDALKLAETDKGDPLMAARTHGTGRTMALALDTTHLWVVDDDGQRMHAKFWQQLVLWLAKRDLAGGNLALKLDKRLVPVGEEPKFTAKLRGKKGEEIKEVEYKVKLVDPQGRETPVPVAAAAGKFKVTQGGEYKLVGTAKGKDADGQPVEGTAEVRLMSEPNDAEALRRAADHEFLKSVADTGGGKCYQAGDLADVLKKLPSEPLPQSPPKVVKWPDWRASRGRSAFLTAFILLFVLLLATEWFLRRQWGLV